MMLEQDRQQTRIPFGPQCLSHTGLTLLTHTGGKRVATSVYVTHDVMVNYPQRSRSQWLCFVTAQQTRVKLQHHEE